MDLSLDSLQSTYNQAKKNFEEGEFEKAADLFEKLIQAYNQIGDKINCAENKNNCSVALLKAEFPQKALDIVLGTDAIFASHGDKKRQAMALGNQAAALEALGENEKALTVYQEASYLLKEIGDKEMRPYILKSIASLEMRKGQYLQSLASTKASIDGNRKPSFSDKLIRKLLTVIFKE